MRCVSFLIAGRTVGDFVKAEQQAVQAEAACTFANSEAYCRERLGHAANRVSKQTLAPFSQPHPKLQRAPHERLIWLRGNHRWLG